MAWDDIKQNGETVTAAEWNASTADQKARIPATQKGTTNGVATLGENGQVPLSQLGNAPSGEGGSGGTGEVDIDSLREKLSPENMDFILLEDHRTGTQMKVRVGNLANIRR
jgi:hypothetical protein